MLGEVPEFKVVEAKETPANETPDAAKPGQTCPLKFQIFFIGVSKFRFVHVQYDEFWWVEVENLLSQFMFSLLG